MIVQRTRSEAIKAAPITLQQRLRKTDSHATAVTATQIHLTPTHAHTPSHLHPKIDPDFTRFRQGLPQLTRLMPHLHPTG